MEKILHPYDKECLRLAMLKHEETFREQVYELHRLYRIQKMLMDNDGQQRCQKMITIGPQNHDQQDNTQRNSSSDDKSMRNNNNNNVMGLIVEQCDDQAGIRSNGQERIAESNSNMRMLDEKEIELTLSLGCPSTAHKSESGQSISSSSTGSSQTRPNNNSSLITRSGDQQLRWGTFHQGSESKLGFSNGQQTGSASPWLFHALSLKLTSQLSK